MVTNKRTAMYKHLTGCCCYHRHHHHHHQYSCAVIITLAAEQVVGIKRGMKRKKSISSNSLTIKKYETNLFQCVFGTSRSCNQEVPGLATPDKDRKRTFLSVT